MTLPRPASTRPSLSAGLQGGGAMRGSTQGSCPIPSPREFREV
jgi:hypothetical protein